MTNIEIQWVSHAEDIPQHLWEQCFPQPLEGFWWYSTLDRCGIGDQFIFAYAIIVRSGVRIGIAPTFLMDVPIDIVAPPLVARTIKIAAKFSPRLLYQRTLFVGSPCSDEGTVGLVQGENIHDIIPALQHELDVRARQSKASMIVWKDLPHETCREIGPLLLDRGLFRLVSFPGTRLALRGSAFEDYLKALTSHQRYNLRKKLRQSHSKGGLEESIIQSPDDTLLGEIFGLFLQTYEHGETKFERLTPAFFKLISACPVSHFVLLRDAANGKLVAFMLCFLLGKRVINKFIGIDYSYGGNWFLYFRLWQTAVTWTLGTGAEELQSGQTGYQAKYDLGNRFVPLSNYCKHFTPVVHHIFRTIAGYISWSTLDDDLKTLETVLKKEREKEQKDTAWPYIKN
jgi:hypothetical protein